MNKYIKSGVLLLMTAAVLLMCLSGAIADTISSGGGVVLVYNSATTAAPSLTSVVAQQESTNVNGWYKVKEANGYVRASDITVHETSAPTAAPTATPSATPSPGPTVPGVTPTPGPLIVPETDTSFEGQVISFKVPTGGLWLYDQIDGSAVLSIAAGTTIILNKQEGTTWYTTHYNGRTYFIPESLTNYAPTETIRPQDINSITLTQQVTLYTGYNQSTRTLSGITTHVLEAGTRVNVKHVHQYFDSGNKRDVYSHVINGTTYYFLDANDMPKSSGSIVVDNDGTAIILHITVQPVVNLYRSKTNLLDDFINLPNTLTLRGQRMDDEFYRVEYKNELFYVKISDIGGADVLEIVSGGNAATQNTHQITAGVDGAKLYSTRTMANGLPSDWSGIKLDPGQTVLASPYDANWYTYVKNVGGVDKVFYLYAKELGNATATDKINSAKILLDESTELYDTMRANAGATTIQLPLAYYTVQVVDSNWYSIIYDGQTYYIKRGEVSAKVSLTITTAHWSTISGIPSNPPLPAIIPNSVEVSATVIGIYYKFTYDGNAYLMEINDYQDTNGNLLDPGSIQVPIATTGENGTYYVTIGIGGAVLYNDAALTSPAGLSLQAGETVKATKYTSSLYIVEQNGAKYYMPVSHIASVRDGDDASVHVQINPEDSIGSVVGGGGDNAYATEVISYTVPKSGLWLYRNASSLSTAAVCLNEGAVVRLNYYDVNYYTVWYNGVQYYVPKTSLVVPEDQVNTSAIYAVELIAPAELFTNNTLTTKTSPIITLSSGSVINVRIARKNTSGTIAAYSYEHSDGKTYYINANTVDPTKLLGATVASNLDTNLITSITVSANVWAYSSPKITSSSIEITAGTTVYGVSYDAAWYKIIHNDSVWYLRRDADPAAVVSQIAIAGNAASATCTVVIGIEGAKLYDKPQTNAARQTVGGIVYEPGMLNYIGTSLQPGAIVQAYQYDSGWYSIAHGGVTRYFQLGKTSNSSLNDSIQSYRITIPGPGPYNNILYSTISDLSNPLTTVSLPAGTFAMRKINQVWSQVVLNNVTYYIKNVDLATLFATEYEEATPIASTTVGKSYRITIGPNGNGDPAKIYTNDLLTGTLLATNVAGYQTMGLKLHVAGAVNNDKMVYRITYSGQTAYVSAEFIVGILEGDEVEEARLRAEQEQNTDSTIPIGQTNLYVFTANTQLYRAMSTGGTPLLLPAQTTLQATKVNADWYSVTYNGETYYIRSSVIEPGGTTAGGTVQVVMDVGDTYTHTFTHGVFAYSTMSTSGQEIFIPEGSVYQLYKINEDWYEITYQGEKAYIQVKEINLPRVPVGGSATLVTTPPTTTTPDAGLTDGTGYITSLLIINPTSGTVNLRRTASLSATILDRIPKGTQVVNNGYTHDASGQIWYSVTYNGRTGYVRGDLVAPVGGGSGGGGSGSLDPAGDMGKSFLVNTASVNVRQGPGTTYAIIGQMAKNATVVPISYEFGSDGFAWYRFQFSGSKYGYIRSDYLAGSAANTVQQSGNVAIRLGGTNMRSGPGDTFNVIAQLNRDIIVTILGTSTDSKNVLWYRITVDGKSGYVRADLVRPLTTAEQGGLQNDIVSQYIELKSGSKGPEVVALQQQLINLGFLAAGNADGTYGPKTVEAVRAFQASKGLSANGVASPGMQAMLFNTTNIQPGTTTTLDWFAIGNSLLGANKNIQIFDIQAQITWNATFIHGENHADVVPASKTDADKLKANNITGSYVRRPVIVTIGGQKYAGSMYAVGHGSTSYVNYFSGVMCIHFTGSRTHGSNNVDPDHQKAIQDALNYANTN